MACPVSGGSGHLKPFGHPSNANKSIINKLFFKYSTIKKKWPALIIFCKGFVIISIVWSIRRLIYIYIKYKKYLPGFKSLLSLIIANILYITYHCYQVHKYLKWHSKSITKILLRAKNKKVNNIAPVNQLNYSYSESVSEKQFNSNMEYFRTNRNPKGGFYSNHDIMATFSESCTFLGGARAALLQVAHPFIAISVKKHSYIIKQSKMNKIIQNEDNIDMVNDCDYKSLSRALKSRFNRTFGVLFPIVYGPLNKSLNGARRAWYQHKQINGKLIDDDSAEIIGDGVIFNKNTYYDATMSMPLRWVWSTLVEGTVFTQQLMGVLPYGDNLNEKQIAFYRECYKASLNTAMAFGLNMDQIPANIEEFEDDYWFNIMESDHIVVSKDCSRWCKVFFMANNWYSKPAVYALKCYTAVMFPESVRNKFNKYDPNLLPLNKFIYIYGVLWLGISRATYALLPKSMRLLNDYMDFQERIHGENYYNKIQKFMKRTSGHIANLIVYIGIEG